MIVSAIGGRTMADPRRTRVWLDGVEVTNDCQVAIAGEPDEAGAVLLLKRNKDGRAYVNPRTRTVARIWRRGSVVIGAR